MLRVQFVLVCIAVFIFDFVGASYIFSRRGLRQQSLDRLSAEPASPRNAVELDEPKKSDKPGKGSNESTTWEKTTEAADKFDDKVDRNMDKIQSLDPEAMLRRDFKKFLDALMPGYKFKVPIIINASIVFGVSVLWFTLYFRFLYTSDRSESMARWKSAIESAKDDDRDYAPNPDLESDIVFVFHHPQHPHPDKDKELKKESMENCIPKDKKDGTAGSMFKHTEAEMARFEDKGILKQVGEAVNKVKKTASTVGHKLTKSPRNKDAEGSDAQSSQTPLGPPTYGSARVAVLKDLYKSFQEWGFEVHLFTSIDDDEIFMSVSLADRMSRWYMIENDGVLQVQQKVLDKLDIKYDEDAPGSAASSPPFVRYDPNLVDRLYRAGILENNSECEFYRVHYGRHKDGTVIGGRERIRVILRQITSHFNIDSAKNAGLIVDWFPAHSRHRLIELHAAWARFCLIFDLSYVQPIPLIREYFGSRVAFNFAFNGFYCKCLLGLLPISLLTNIWIFVETEVLGTPATMSDKQVIGWCIVMGLWSRLTMNLWTREQSYFLKLWEMESSHEQPIMRAEYHGYEVKSPLNTKVIEKQYPKSLSILRQLLSGSVTLMYSVFVAIVIVTWVDRSLSDNGKLSLEANIVLTILIKTFEFVYNLMATALTDFENHKYQSGYYNSYLWKQIFFQSVNYYMPFIYLAVMQRRHEAGCPKEGCTAALRVSLTITLVIICACRLAEVTVMAYKVKFTLWWERRQLEKQGLDIPHLSFTEEQAKYGEYRTREQVEAVLELVLSLGYVLIFGAVAPITVVFCLLVFVVQMRASAYLLTSSVKRTLPRRQNGIGAWNEVVGILMKIAIIFEAFLLISVGASFKGAAILAKVTGFIVFLLCMVVLWGAIDFILPPVDDETTLLGGRRDYAHRVILQRSGMTSKTVNKPGNQSGGWGCKKRKSQTESSIGAATVLTEDACNAIIETDGWDQIPHLDGTPAKHEEDGAASQR
eukprot:gnl/TRDRNA2_/TRDRNA2_164860_c0_seq5.p1 gnl/TRDRNA2_/TRDRNA2_164860_c0~~gnl/TRDRNA2_/TRDRNA2_164860_c0_seq5.p1  ORF type:complete len:986 (-),score=182.33 gnl/TRDRNA2_/TRDRNA2_164860_c0_seq5:151-3108(-)